MFMKKSNATLGTILTNIALFSNINSCRHTLKKECVNFAILFLIITAQIPMAVAIDVVDVWPGNYHEDFGYDYKLGKDFPTEDTVKLDYPKSTILTNITGELMFNVTLTTFNYTNGAYPNSIRKSLSIYFPPEFIINNRVESVWTSFTNDYSSISIRSASSVDPIAPNWNVLTISNLNITKPINDKDDGDVTKRRFIENRTQYIRIFNITSPDVAGRYFFKTFISLGRLTYSIGARNFPTIVVKGALNPAYVSGIVVNGEPTPPELYGMPLDDTIYSDGTVLLPSGYGGRVYAEGLTDEGYDVEAQAYFNSSSGGRFTLYGLAPATYNVTVEAAGYVPRKFLNIITVAMGQSIEGLTLPLKIGVEVSGIVYSKHGTSMMPWGHSYNLTNDPVNRTIQIEITDLDENIIASSPLRLYDRTALDFRPKNYTDYSLNHYNFSIRSEVSFDGHIPQDYANYTSGIPSGDYYVKAHVTNYVQLNPVVVAIINGTTSVQTFIDLQRTNYFEITVHFNNMSDTLYPAPTKIGGYLYLEVLDPTGAVSGFNMSYVPVGSRNFTMQVRGIDIWNRLNQAAHIWGSTHDGGLLPGTYEINALFMNKTTDFIALNALMTASPQVREIYPTTTEALTEAFSEETLELTNRQTPLYFQVNVIKTSIGGFCNSASKLSFHLALGGGFDITIYSVDWQDPPKKIDWAYPRSRMRIDIQTSEGSIIDTLYATQPNVGNSIFISSMHSLGLKTGIYMLIIYTPGYIEDERLTPITIPVTLGHISDIPIYLFIGATIDLTLGFKTEQNFEAINNKLCYARPINNIDATPIRVEVFDEFGEFVAANRTYVESNSTNIQITLYGFNGYSGNPRLLWTNFYDTTDGSRMSDSGLGEGEYQIRINAAGYYQIIMLQVKIDSMKAKNVSVIESIERLGYLSGYVTWANWLRDAYPLSWASITAYHVNNVEEVYTYSLDGFYEMWLVAGEYDFGLSHPGLETQYLKNGLHISWGACSSLIFHMDEEIFTNEEAVPEFSSVSLIPSLAISTLLLLLRKCLLK